MLFISKKHDIFWVVYFFLNFFVIQILASEEERIKLLAYEDIQEIIFDEITTPPPTLPFEVIRRIMDYLPGNDPALQFLAHYINPSEESSLRIIEAFTEYLLQVDSIKIVPSIESFFETTKYDKTQESIYLYFVNTKEIIAALRKNDYPFIHAFFSQDSLTDNPKLNIVLLKAFHNASIRKFVLYEGIESCNSDYPPMVTSIPSLMFYIVSGISSTITILAFSVAKNSDSPAQILTIGGVSAGLSLFFTLLTIIQGDKRLWYCSESYQKITKIIDLFHQLIQKEQAYDT